MTSKIVQDLGFEYVESVVENHTMAIFLPTCESCCEVQSFSINRKPVNHVDIFKKSFLLRNDEGVSSITGL